jgi:hypothetical protein
MLGKWKTLQLHMLLFAVALQSALKLTTGCSVCSCAVDSHFSQAGLLLVPLMAHGRES